MIDPSFSLLVALAFIVLFATAGLQKLRSPSIFVATLADYRIVPRALLWVAAGMVIALELIVALGLFWDTTRATSALIGAGLLMAYGGSIALNLIRGRRHMDCGCAAQRRPIGRRMVARNAILATTLLFESLPITARTMGWVDSVTVGGGVLVLVLLYASLDTLSGQIPSMETP
jgi:hypothetical protein